MKQFSFATGKIEVVLAAIGSGIAADRTTAAWNFPDNEDIVFYRGGTVR